MQITNLVITCFFIIYLICAYEDYKDGEIYSIYLYLLLFLSFFFYKNISYLEVKLYFIIFITLFFLDKDEKLMGKGDYPVIISSVLVLSNFSSLFIFLASLFAFVESFYKKSSRIRFIPFLFLGFIITYIIKYLI